MTPSVVAGYAALAICGLTILLGVIRLIKGPNLADRVVVLDLFSAVGVAVTAAWSMAADDVVYLDVALLVALVAFLGTVALARYAEGGGPR